MSKQSGTDALFPCELRQNVFDGLVVFLLREQELLERGGTRNIVVDSAVD
jgi:hypothetical protein